jgi:hypothetical protein
MSFKLNGAPYNKDNMNIAVYRKDLKDGSAGKSNHTGIIVDKDVSPEMEKAVVAHETVHQHQQRNGELDYDKENFYWKGKTYPRENLNEHNENLPWEKEAYAKSNGILNGKQEDMKERFQLKGYRGNNKPFKTMSDRGLIGAQSDGASAEMCGIGGGDDPTKCKGSTKAYDKIQGKKTRTRRTKNPKNKTSKFVYTKVGQERSNAPETIKSQPDEVIEHNIWDNKGKIAPTINIPSVNNIDDNVSNEIKNRPGHTKKIINNAIKGVDNKVTSMTSTGDDAGLTEGTRYKKVRRKGQTKFKQKGSYTLSEHTGKPSELYYTKGKNKMKSITSDDKKFDKKLKKVTGKISKNASFRGDGDKFVNKNKKRII